MGDFLNTLLNAVCTPIAMLGQLLGPVLQPLLDLTTGNILIMLVMTAVFGAVWIGLSFGERRYCIRMTTESVEVEFKLQMTWLHGAFLVGYLTALSGEYHSKSLFGDGAMVSDMKLTFFNVMEWQAFPKIALVAAVFGILFCGVLYWIFMGPMGTIRVLSGFPFFYFLGQLIMSLRVSIAVVLSEASGLLFLVQLVFTLAANFLEVIPVILLPIFFVAFLMPKEVAAEMNRRREREEREYREKKSSSGTGSASRAGSASHRPSGPSVPPYVTDEDGNHLSVELRGDFLYIMGPGGELSVKWEYVKGQNHFYLQGKRFYMGDGF